VYENKGGMCIEKGGICVKKGDIKIRILDQNMNYFKNCWMVRCVVS
jgi:hypothetical protein